MATTLEGARELDPRFFDFVQWDGAAAPALSPAGSGRLYFDAASNKFKVSENGGAYFDLLNTSTGWAQGGNSFGANGVFGTNDAFEIQFRTSGTTRMTLLAGSRTLQFATGVGTIIGGPAVTDGLIIRASALADSDGQIRFFTGSSAASEVMRVTNDGTVGRIVSIGNSHSIFGTLFPTLQVRSDVVGGTCQTVLTNNAGSGARSTRLTLAVGGLPGFAALHLSETMNLFSEASASINHTGDQPFDISVNAGSNGKLRLSTLGANPLQFFTNAIQRGQFLSSGEFLINATALVGTEKLQVNGDFRFGGDFDLLPFADNTLDVGTDALRIKRGRFVTVVTGDLELKSEEAHWKLQETPDEVLAVNEKTGRRYRLSMEELVA